MQTTITSFSTENVSMRLADHADPDKAKEWIQLQVAVSAPVLPPNETPLGDPSNYFLATVQIAALTRAHTLIGAEIQRLRLLSRKVS